MWHILGLCYRPMHEITFSSDDKPKLLSQVKQLLPFYAPYHYYGITFTIYGHIFNFPYLCHYFVRTIFVSDCRPYIFSQSLSFKNYFHPLGIRESWMWLCLGLPKKSCRSCDLFMAYFVKVTCHGSNTMIFPADFSTWWARS